MSPMMAHDSLKQKVKWHEASSTKLPGDAGNGNTRICCFHHSSRSVYAMPEHSNGISCEVVYECRKKIMVSLDLPQCSSVNAFCAVVSLLRV